MKNSFDQRCLSFGVQPFRAQEDHRGAAFRLPGEVGMKGVIESDTAAGLFAGKIEEIFVRRPGEAEVGDMHGIPAESASRRTRIMRPREM